MPAPATPRVLFVCVHNAGRSQMAAGWLAHLAGSQVEVRSAGSAPAEQINPVAVQVMHEVGIDITAEHPKILTAPAVRASDVVVTMGCGDSCPVFPGTRHEDWQLEDPAGQGVDVMRRVRDEIRSLVRVLLADLLAPARPQPTGVQVVAMTDAHADPVLAIYQAGIDEGDATFEARAPQWADFTAHYLPAHRFVALDQDAGVLGWSAASAVSERCAYAGVAEDSVYVHPRARGRGVGRALLDALISATERAGIWTLQAGVFPENAASLALHRACGFRVVGTRQRLARQQDLWRDVVLLERRSSVIG